MIIRLQDIRSTVDGFARLAEVADEAKDCCFDAIEVDMSSTAWFDANMSAPLGVLFTRWADDLNTVQPVALRPGVEAETQAGSLDFNDGVLVEVCRIRGWKLLTNDADMQLGGIEVLTTNPKLLAACP